jgi:hypothetical protein
MTSNQPWWLTMPPAELAAAILPFFSSRPHMRERDAMTDIVSWWKTGSVSRSVFRDVALPLDMFTKPDHRAVAEAIQALEHAGLLMRDVGDDMAAFYVGLTRQGMHALQTNTVRQHLGLSDAPPAQL